MDLSSNFENINITSTGSSKGTGDSDEATEADMLETLVSESCLYSGYSFNL
jgi:hypothetical protein